MGANPLKRNYSKAFGLKQLVFAAAVLACVGSSMGESIPPEHMRRDLSRLLNKRQGSTNSSSIKITVINNCSETVWPGLNTQTGDPPSVNGFELDPGQSQDVYVSSQWQGRIWPRTNCTFPNPNPPNQACGTGDCAGALNCTVSVSYLDADWIHALML
jgi:Thaumatin family